jgi:hypothetical protein
MRLDQLEWEGGRQWSMRVARIPGRPHMRVWLVVANVTSTTGADYLAGTYAITIDYDAGDFPQYRNLSAIEAQAILYHLLKE